MSKFIQFNDSINQIVNLDQVNSACQYGNYLELIIGEKHEIHKLSYENPEERNKDGKRLLRALNVRAKEKENLK